MALTTGDQAKPPKRVMWVPISNDPPSVYLDGEVWLICPWKGFTCCRVLVTAAGEQWAADAMAVHVWLHHTTWR